MSRLFKFNHNIFSYSCGFELIRLSFFNASDSCTNFDDRESLAVATKGIGERKCHIVHTILREGNVSRTRLVITHCICDGCILSSPSSCGLNRECCTLNEGTSRSVGGLYPVDVALTFTTCRNIVVQTSLCSDFTYRGKLLVSGFVFKRPKCSKALRKGILVQILHRSLNIFSCDGLVPNLEIVNNTINTSAECRCTTSCNYHAIRDGIDV